MQKRLICSILMRKGHHIFVSAVLVRKSYEERGVLDLRLIVQCATFDQPRASHTRVIWRSATKDFKTLFFTHANNSQFETAKYLNR